MKKTIFLMFIALLTIVTPVAAQNRHNGKGKDMMKEIREFKVKFLAQEMDLKDDQRTAFVDLYNDMDEKRSSVMKEVWKAERELKNNKGATEEDYRRVSDLMTRSREKSADIEKEYDGKFSKILTPKQLFKMKAAENEFQRKMDEMRHRRNKK